jgi:hypothetical protein
MSFVCVHCSRWSGRRLLLSQAAAGTGFWEDLLGELRREGLIAELLADGRSRKRRRAQRTGTS